jgi:hypothetical protein
VQISAESHLRSIEDSYLHRMDTEKLLPYHSLEERMDQYRREVDQRARAEIAAAVRHLHKQVAGKPRIMQVFDLSKAKLMGKLEGGHCHCNTGEQKHGLAPPLHFEESLRTLHSQIEYCIAVIIHHAVYIRTEEAQPILRLQRNRPAQVPSLMLSPNELSASIYKRSSLCALVNGLAVSKPLLFS